MTKLLAQSNVGVLGASLTNQGSNAGTTELATHAVEMQTTTKCTDLGKGIECPIEMQPSIKPTRLLEGHPIESKGKTRHGDIGHITKMHI
jgi:hypothetical protein